MPCLGETCMTTILLRLYLVIRKEDVAGAADTAWDLQPFRVLAVASGRALGRFTGVVSRRVPRALIDLTQGPIS